MFAEMKKRAEEKRKAAALKSAPGGASGAQETTEQALTTSGLPVAAEGDEATPWTVNYNHVLSYALAAIKDLDAIVQAQATRIATLEAKKSRTRKV